MGSLGSQDSVVTVVALFVLALVILGIFLIIRYGVKNKRLHHRVTELERKLKDRDRHPH